MLISLLQILCNSQNKYCKKTFVFFSRHFHQTLSLTFIIENVAKKHNVNNFINEFLCHHKMSVYSVTLNVMLILSYFMEVSYLTNSI
jgi:hypothetical protein